MVTAQLLVEQQQNPRCKVGGIRLDPVSPGCLKAVFDEDSRNFPGKQAVEHAHAITYLIMVISFEAELGKISGALHCRTHSVQRPLQFALDARVENSVGCLQAQLTQALQIRQQLVFKFFFGRRRCL